MARSYVHQTQLVRAATYPVSVSTSAVLIAGADGSAAVIEVFNNHATAALFVSNDPNVTAATGRPVPAQQAHRDEHASGPLYAVAAGATDVRVTRWLVPNTL